MTATNETVHDRFERAGVEVTPVQFALGVGLAAAVGFTLLFLQEPLAHDSLHHFRHVAGVTCH